MEEVSGAFYVWSLRQVETKALLFGQEGWQKEKLPAPFPASTESWCSLGISGHNCKCVLVILGFPSHPLFISWGHSCHSKRTASLPAPMSGGTGICSVSADNCADFSAFLYPACWSKFSLTWRHSWCWGRKPENSRLRVTWDWHFDPSPGYGAPLHIPPGRVGSSLPPAASPLHPSNTSELWQQAEGPFPGLASGSQGSYFPHGSKNRMGWVWSWFRGYPSHGVGETVFLTLIYAHFWKIKQ